MESTHLHVPMNDKPTRPVKQFEKRLEMAHRLEKAIEMKRGGYTYQYISDELGYGGAGNALVAIKKYMENLPKQSAEEHRQESVDQVNFSLNSLRDKVAKGDLRAIDRWGRLLELRAKLRGEFAAQKHEHSGPDGAPIVTVSASFDINTMNIRELQDFIRSGTKTLPVTPQAPALPENIIDIDVDE